MAYTLQDSHTGGADSGYKLANSSGSQYIAGSFKTGSAYTLTAVEIELIKFGSLAGKTLTAYIYSATASPGAPNASLATSTNTIDANSFLTSGSAWSGKFTFAGIALTTATWYYIVIKIDVIGDATNYLSWFGNWNGVDDVAISSAGTTWSSYSTAITDYKTYSGGGGGGGILLKIIDETAEVSDGYTRRMAMTRPVVETEALPEGIQRIGILRRILADTVSLTEGLLHRGALKRVISEAQSISETVVKSISSLIVKAVNEGMQIAETIALRLGLTRTASEGVSISEDAARRGALRRILSETASIAEGIIRSRALVRIAAESMNLVEAAIRRAGLIRVVSETLSLAEGTLKFLGIVKIINEGMSLIESIAKKLGLDTLGVLGENLTLVFRSVSRGIRSMSNKRGIASKTPKREVKP